MSALNEMNKVIAGVAYTPNRYNSQGLDDEVSSVNNFTVIRTADPHSFFADPDPAVLLNADPDLDNQHL